MNDSEKQTIVFIPRNFIEKGTFMGGMFKTAMPLKEAS